MCMATAIYFEARGEPLAGQYAVAEVIMNRQQDDRFPDTVCAVVTEERVRGKCQFSFVCDGDKPIREPEAFVRAATVAAITLTGDTSYAGGALYFHTRNVSPSWARSMDVTTAIGSHVFLSDMDSINDK